MDTNDNLPQPLTGSDDGTAAIPPTHMPVPSASTPATNHPVTADDVDLIEKEWVEKAKEIVGGTSSDPYLQSKQLNKMKADYLKKRYKKDIKVDE